MGCFIRFLQTIERHMRINLRGHEVRMAEQFLHASQVRSTIQQVCRVTMSQLVRRETGIESDARQVYF